MVTASKIVHCIKDFKSAPRASGSRPETFKNHLVGIASRPFALLGRAHGPGQQQQAENIARDPGRRRWQLIDPIGDEMWPGAEGMTETQHALALGGRRLRPGRFTLSAFR